MLRAVGFAALVVTAPTMARAPDAMPVPKTGACPSGYQSSGSYCKPGTGARFALEKVGACPSGYQTSGAYCLASPGARLAVVKRGSCPSGFQVSGAYCLSSR